MAIYSSILAWRIPWTEEPGRLQSVGLQRVRHDWATSTHDTFTYLSFGSTGYSLLLRGLPLVAVSRSYSLLRYMGFSWQWLLCLCSISSRCESSIVAAFGHTGSVVEACRALEHRLRSCGTWAELLCSMWDLLGPGIKHMRPSLAGRIIYSMPPGKFYYGFLSLSSWVTALTRKWLDPAKSLPFGLVYLTLSQYYHWNAGPTIKGGSPQLRKTFKTMNSKRAEVLFPSWLYMQMKGGTVPQSKFSLWWNQWMPLNKDRSHCTHFSEDFGEKHDINPRYQGASFLWPLWSTKQYFSNCINFPGPQETLAILISLSQTQKSRNWPGRDSFTAGTLKPDLPKSKVDRLWIALSSLQKLF